MALRVVGDYPPSHYPYFPYFPISLTLFPHSECLETRPPCISARRPLGWILVQNAAIRLSESDPGHRRQSRFPPAPQARRCRSYWAFLNRVLRQAAPLSHPCARVDPSAGNRNNVTSVLYPYSRSSQRYEGWLIKTSLAILLGAQLPIFDLTF